MVKKHKNEIIRIKNEYFYLVHKLITYIIHIYIYIKRIKK